MTDPAPTAAQRLAQAEAEAAAARARVNAGFVRVQAKLDPRRIAHRAVRDVTDAGTTAAEAGVDTARRNPAALVGIAALTGLFLARHRLARLIRRATHGGDAS